MLSRTGFASTLYIIGLINHSYFGEPTIETRQWRNWIVRIFDWNTKLTLIKTPVKSIGYRSYPATVRVGHLQPINYLDWLYIKINTRPVSGSYLMTRTTNCFNWKNNIKFDNIHTWIYFDSPVFREHSSIASMSRRISASIVFGFEFDPILFFYFSSSIRSCDRFFLYITRFILYGVCSGLYSH